MRNIISFLFSLDFSVKCDLDTVRLIHMADTQSCRNRVFCYICLLCLCSSAHLYRRTPSIPACPQHALPPPPRYLNGPLSLSVFSLSTANPLLYFSLTQHGLVIRQSQRFVRPTDPLTLQVKMKCANHFTCSCDVQYLQVKQDIQWDQEYLLWKLISWILEWSMSAGVCCCSYWLINLQKWLVLDVVCVSSVIKRPTPCLSVRAVRHSAGLWNLLSAALMEVQIHVHTHNISHMLWHCGWCVMLASLLTGKHYRNEP